MFIECVRSETWIRHRVHSKEYRSSPSASPSFIYSQNQRQGRNDTDQMIDFIKIRLQRIVTSSINNGPPANRELEQSVDLNPTEGRNVCLAYKNAGYNRCDFISRRWATFGCHLDRLESNWTDRSLNRISSSTSLWISMWSNQNRSRWSAEVI